MTLITFQDGKPVMRDGLVGTGVDCCCGSNGCCCIDGSPDPTKTTQAACEAAGGTWNSDGPCKTYDCRCCEDFKVICHERVYSQYTVVLDSLAPLTNPCQPDAVNDTSDGLIAIDAGPVVLCGGTFEEQYCTTDWANRCNGNDDLEIGSTGTFAQYYDRWRAVADCDECQDTGGAFCTPGILLLGCYTWQSQQISGLIGTFCDCDLVDLCANPLP